MFPKPCVRYKLIGSDPDDWSQVRILRGPGDHGEIEADDNKWTYGEKRESVFRKLAERWRKVEKGMQIDVEAGKQLGETSPPEYWNRVWNDMHTGNGGPPGNLPNSFLREKWSEMKDSGSTDQECWDTLDIQYPVAFMGLPLLKRWENLGDGKSVEETRGEMFGWVEEFNRVLLQKELKDRLQEMQRQGEEESFWRTNWDTVYKAKVEPVCSENGETWIFPVTQKNENGDLVRIEPNYKQYYPTDFGRSNICAKKSSVREQALFSEFDFV